MKLKASMKIEFFRRFRNEEHGAVSVSAALWVPFFVFLVTLVFDISMIFYGQARAHEVAENVNRSLSVGQIASHAEAELMVRTSLASISPNATAWVESEDSVIRTVVRMPTSDLAGIGFFKSIASFEITAVAHMVKEF